MNTNANYIGGEWVAEPEVGPDVNPSDTNDVVGHYPRSSRETTRSAIDVAAAAAQGWAGSSPQFRADVLGAAARELAGRADEFGALLAREEGKSLREAVGEAARAAQILAFASGEAMRMGGENIQSTRPGVFVDILREPVGVVGVITPWNFPLAIPAWKIGPALAYGNTVVFKPADLVPACAVALVDCLARAGLPPGVLNLIMGRGSVIGEEIATNPAVDAVTFTGSTAVGRGVAERAVSRLAKVQLEMGGKNPLVVLADADLEAAVECAVQGAFFSTGQRCTASSRLIVEAAVLERFVDAVHARLQQLSVDDATLPSTDIGPVVDERQLEVDVSFIEKAKAEPGATVVGGELLTRRKPGHYLQPALITGLATDHSVNREEIFGPVASVIPASDFDEAVALANDTEYGLVAGICTTSLSRAHQFRRAAKAGMVMVNLPTAGVDVHVPFGGTRGSSYGPKEQGSYAREFFTTTKTVYTNP